jgi:hypothetical protein
MKWASPADWSGIDLTGHARIWTQDQDSVQRRMTNRSKVWIVEAAALNHLEGRTGRMLFAQAYDAVSVVACNSNPLLSVRWIDNVVNARSRAYRVLALPRDSDIYTANHSAVIYTNAASSTNAVFPEKTPTPTFPSDLVYREFKTARGGANNAIFTEAVSAANGLPLVDICCQEEQVNTLDTALDHDFVFAYGATPGAKIVTGILEDLRSKFHTLRMNQNRLAFCFLGLGASNAYGDVETSALGFSTDSDTYVNMLDQTVTTRTATSPGVMVPGYASGVGLSNSCGIQVYILARKGRTSGDAGWVKVIGPDHVAANHVEIEVPSSDVAWYSGGPVYLNTESAEATDVTTARNKFDFHFLVNAGEMAWGIYVYAVLGFTLQT